MTACVEPDEVPAEQAEISADQAAARPTDAPSAGVAHRYSELRGSETSAELALGATIAGFTNQWRTAGCEFARVAQTASAGGHSMPVTPPALAAVITRIEQAGRADFAESYAGVEVDQHQVQATVYRMPSATFDYFIRMHADLACVIVRDAAHSNRELTRWHDQVFADLPFWISQGIQIVTIGSRHDGAGVEVGTSELDRARRELPARYGAQAPLIFLPADPIATFAVAPTDG